MFAVVVRDGIRRRELRACAAKRVADALVVATNALLPADLRPDEIDATQVRARASTIGNLLIHGIALTKEKR